MANRLAGEASPYLRQHADQPVDWYPWGEEALALARREDRPILLSVGYAACHWCHVMAEESFADPALAAEINAHFVPIKVDREERPDLDAVYQAICQMVTHQGGWPLTVFLTPDLRPFYVGTYFPPVSRYGRPGFGDLLRSLARAWREQRQKVREVADHWTQALKELELPPPRGPIPDRQAVGQAVDQLIAAFDREGGGLGQAPKFPHTEALSLMLEHAADGGSAEGGRLAVMALRRMAAGGVYDQLAGGFHRYAVDAHWRIPHFEKMLYDNALLPPVYLDAYRLTGDGELARVARETLDYLVAELRHPAGGFCSSTDADSADGEGGYFTWRPEEVRAVLGPEDGELAIARYGVGEAALEDGRSVLYLARTPEELAAARGEPVEEVARRLTAARQRLLAARRLRPAPARDAKILAGWNGLAVSAFARAYGVLGREEDLATARTAAAFLKERLTGPDGTLFRRWAEGAAGLPATLEDYAYVVAGWIDLYEADLDRGHLAEAIRLARLAVARFWQPEAGTFYLTPPEGGDLIQRPRAEGDSGTPSPQSVMVRCLLRLVPFTGETRWREIAEAVLARHASLLTRHAWGMSSLASCLDLWQAGPTEVTLVAHRQAPEVAAWRRVLARRLVPRRVLGLVEPGQGEAAAQELGTGLPPPIWEGKDGGPAPAAYLCRDGACSPPLPTAQDLEAALGPPVRLS